MKQALSFAALSLIQAAAIASVPVPSTSGAVSNEPHALLEIKGLEYSAPHMTMEKKAPARVNAADFTDRKSVV